MEEVVTAGRVRWLALVRTPGVGPMRAWSVARRLGKRGDIDGWDEARLSREGGLSAKLAASACEATRCHEAELELAAIAARGLRTHDPWDDYPEPLAELHDPPPFLISRGALGLDPAAAEGLEQGGGLRVGLVGARAATLAGLGVARRLGAELAARDVTVVSGLARGIDAAALEGALAAGGLAIAVLGHGLHTIYPHEHWELARRIAERGILLTELPWGTPPAPHQFPRRNRIIAGLCQGLVVVEAGARSGALITAELALDAGREVCAVPGPVDSPMSQGPLELLRQGATLVRNADDILEALAFAAEIGVARRPPSARRPQSPPSSPPPSATRTTTLGPLAEQLLAVLEGRSCSADELAESLDRGISEIAALLTQLELEGAVRRAGARYGR